MWSNPKVVFLFLQIQINHRVLQLYQTKCCSLIKYMNENNPVEVHVPDPGQKHHG